VLQNELINSDSVNYQHPLSKQHAFTECHGYVVSTPVLDSSHVQIINHRPDILSRACRFPWSLQAKAREVPQYRPQTLPHPFKFVIY
jgi:hypothetical protein